MSKSVTPFLMFTQGGCEEALRFYVSLFPESWVDQMTYFPEGTPMAGTVMLAEFTLKGRPYRANDSVGLHAFDFTPSFSLFVDCDDADELDGLFEILKDGGQVMMPVDNYGFSQRFGWVQDRFKMSWQLNLA